MNVSENQNNQTIPMIYANTQVNWNLDSMWRMKSMEGERMGDNLQNPSQHFTPIYRFCLPQKSTCNYNKKGEK